MPTETSSQQGRCDTCATNVRLTTTHIKQKDAGGRAIVDYRTTVCENGHEVPET